MSKNEIVAQALAEYAGAPMPGDYFPYGTPAEIAAEIDTAWTLWGPAVRNVEYDL
jgi:hypothetical protein